MTAKRNAPGREAEPGEQDHVLRLRMLFERQHEVALEHELSPDGEFTVRDFGQAYFRFDVRDGYLTPAVFAQRGEAVLLEDYAQRCTDATKWLVEQGYMQMVSISSFRLTAKGKKAVSSVD